MAGIHLENDGLNLYFINWIEDINSRYYYEALNLIKTPDVRLDP